MKVTVMERQTLADIAMEIYGTVEALPSIAQANGLSMSDLPTEGSILECPDIEFDRYKQTYARNNEIKPATA